MVWLASSQVHPLHRPTTYQLNPIHRQYVYARIGDLRTLIFCLSSQQSLLPGLRYSGSLCHKLPGTGPWTQFARLHPFRISDFGIQSHQGCNGLPSSNSALHTYRQSPHTRIRQGAAHLVAANMYIVGLSIFRVLSSKRSEVRSSSTPQHADHDHAPHKRSGTGMETAPLCNLRHLVPSIGAWCCCLWSRYLFSSLTLLGRLILHWLRCCCTAVYMVTALLRGIALLRATALLRSNAVQRSSALLRRCGGVSVGS